MIRNIIFDIGNVLVKYDWKTYLESFGFSEEKNDRLAQALFLGEEWKELDRGAIPEEEIKSRILEKNKEEAADILTLYAKLEDTIHKEAFAKPWIYKYREEGYRLYYLSNYSERIRHLTEEALDFIPEMDGGLFSYEVKLIKPDPAIYREFLRRYPEVKPEESVFLDDTLPNIETAQKLGFYGIRVKDHKQAAEELKELLQIHGK
ncbi:MAG: HAD family phosphatase [Lachnospiraceae bacterium]|nr:HAD family phosphatase [Lachnospiraceae bacterium]